MFRRRSSGPGAAGATRAAGPGAAGADEDEPPGPARPGLTAAKGRPTPKRSEAQNRRRQQPHSAPGDRKAARQQDATERQRRMAAMKRGEEWALPRKDRGPVRALARDYVDSRRTISEYYMYAVVLLLVALFVPALHKSVLFDYVFLGVLAVLLFEAYLTGQRVVRLARQRYPGESTHGVRLYAAMRGSQMRRLRLPAPRVKVGDKI